MRLKIKDCLWQCQCFCKCCTEAHKSCSMAGALFSVCELLAAVACKACGFLKWYGVRCNKKMGKRKSSMLSTEQHSKMPKCATFYGFRT